MKQFLWLLIVYQLSWRTAGHPTCSKVYPPNATVVITSLLDISNWNFGFPNQNTTNQPMRAQEAMTAVWIAELLQSNRNQDEVAANVIYGIIVCDTFDVTENGGIAAADIRSNMTNSSRRLLGIVGTSKRADMTDIYTYFSEENLPVISHTPLRKNITLTNSFTTAVTIDVRMQAVFDLLMQLDWSYFLLVHTDTEKDMYASTVLKGLIKPHSSHVCIAQTIVINTYSLSKQYRDIWVVIGSLLPKTYDGMIGVVFLSSEKLLLSIMLNSDNALIGKTRWIVPFTVPRLQSRFYFQLAELYSISEPTGLNSKMNEVLSYLGDRNPLNFTWINDFKNGSGVQYQSENLLDFIDGHLNLVSAFRTLLHDCCTPDGGPNCMYLSCTGNMLQSLRLPPPSDVQTQFQAFRNDRRFGFVLGGSELVQATSTLDVFKLYTDMTAAGRPQSYGKYDATKSTQSQSRCNGDCPACIDDIARSILHIPGDYYIIAVFPVHNGDPDDPWKCTDVRSTHGILLYLSLLFAMDVINKTDLAKYGDAARQFQSFNFTLGAILIDDCRQPQRHAYIMSRLLRGEYSDYGFPSLDRIIGVVGSLWTDETIMHTNIANKVNLTVVSYGASVPQLNYRSKYPYFLSTAPSSTLQTQGIIQILKHFNWTIVSLINSKDEYGRGGMENFKMLALQEGICIGAEIEINEHSIMKVVVTTLRSVSSARVVVYIGDEQLILSIAPELQGSGEFVFIGSEVWADRVEITSKPDSYKLLGSLTFKINSGDVSIGDMNMDKFSHNRIPKLNTDRQDVWFAEYWQEKFKCWIPGIFNKKYTADTCNFDQQSITTDASTFIEPFSVPLMNAMFSLVNGVVNASQQLCGQNTPISVLCPKIWQRPDLVYQSVRDVVLTKDAAGFARPRIFNDAGNNNQGYTIFNIKVSSGGKPAYERVGEFTPERTLILDDHGITFYKQGQVPISQLVSECPRPLTTAGTKTPGLLLSLEYIIIIGVGALAFVLLITVIIVCIIFCRSRSSESEMIPIDKMLQPGQNSSYQGSYPISDVMSHFDGQEDLADYAEPREVQKNQSHRQSMSFSADSSCSASIPAYVALGSSSSQQDVGKAMRELPALPREFPDQSYSQ